MSALMNITVGRYSDASTGYLGWVEPEDRSWILFVALDGSVQLFTERDPITGACH